MMVCLCNGVSERKIRKVIDHGASSIDDVTAACKAGGRCGGCRPTIDALLCDAQAGEGCSVRLSVA